jgi:pilus assembly protein CpaF
MTENTTHAELLARLGRGAARESRVLDRAKPKVAVQSSLDAKVEEFDQLTDLRVQLLQEVAEQLSSSRLDSLDADDPHLAPLLRELTGAAFSPTDHPFCRRFRDHPQLRLADDLLGLGPLQPLLADPTVSEVMVNSFDDVWVERAGCVEPTRVRFDDEDHLRNIIDRIVSGVGRRIDESSPMVDARLQDGSRVNAVIAPLALRGAYLTIRRFRDMPLSVEELISRGTLGPKSAHFLELVVRGGANVLISGGTGTGKTTTLNVLSGAIPDNERIVTIEDAAELRLAQRHVLPMESRPANREDVGKVEIRDLVRNSLRMRPDRIIVGECRGPEAVDMLQAMNTGHDGCMTTIHANSPRDALSRLETLVLTSGIELPSRAIREQIASAFDVIVQLERMVDGSRRIIAISDVTGMEGGVVTLQDIYVAKSRSETDVADGAPLRGPLRPTGVIPSFLDKLLVRNVEIPRHLFREVLDR